MNEWELTDEEIDGSLATVPWQKNWVDWKEQRHRAIATAAQKKLVEWLDKNAEKVLVTDWDGDPIRVKFLGEFWHNLKTALGV